MKSLGISITRNRLFAVLREQALVSSKPEKSVSVPCEEPFGGPADFARLAEEVRKDTDGKPLPPVVLSIPPSWTFVRRIKLPVPDLPRAKKMHSAELEGSLPIADEEILSDILPSAPGDPGSFLAIAARRSQVEHAVSVFAEAGFDLDRVITDHVSLFLAALSGKMPDSGYLVSTLNDLTVLRVKGGALLWARQFPWSPDSSPQEQASEILELLSKDEDRTDHVPVVVFGEVPAFLSGLPSLSSYSGSADSADESPIAFGASLAPVFSKETGGFSLRTSAETEMERARGRTRMRIAVAAAGIALLAFVGSVEIAQYAGSRKVARIRAEIRKEFVQAVPGAKVLARETAQIREKIQSLSRQQKELGTDVPEPSSMLEKVSAALPKEGKILVREAAFDSGRLRITGDAPSGQLVETFRTALVEAFGPDMNVTVQGSEGSGTGEAVKYTILIQKGGNDRAS